MKKIHFIFIVFAVLALNNSCTGHSGEKKSNTASAVSGPVEVVYFHTTRRCATCNAVEEVTKTTLTEQFGKKIPFTSYNLEEPKGKAKAEELQVAGQALLILHGEEKINLTSEGFMYARSNPDQLKEVLTKHIKSLL